jgi:hypothetical protein
MSDMMIDTPDSSLDLAEAEWAAVGYDQEVPPGRTQYLRIMGYRYLASLGGSYKCFLWKLLRVLLRESRRCQM